MQDNKNKKPSKKRGVAQGGGLYIALALCILAVICIATYSAIKNMFDISNPGNTPPISAVNPPQTQSPVDNPQTNDAPAAQTGNNNENPVDNPVETNPAGENNNTQDKPVSVDPPYVRTYAKPINGTVSKAFSGDTLVFSTTMNDYRVHNGVDIPCSVGDGVKCFSDGFVESITEDPLMGYTITINHENGLKSVYQNLSDVFPQEIGEGVRVSTGQIIAGVGESALIECAELPHLHFSVLLNGVEVDPEPYFG